MTEEKKIIDTPAEDTSASAAAPKARAKKAKKSVPSGQLHIQSTFNNTIITITDNTGATIVTASAGGSGFRGSKKSTAYAAQVAAEKALEIARRDNGLRSVDVFVKGIGLGRDSAIRATSAHSISISSITDVTPVKHGGTRPKGERKP